MIGRRGFIAGLAGLIGSSVVMVVIDGLLKRRLKRLGRRVRLSMFVIMSGKAGFV